jgi:hypothetical protein
MNPAIEHMLIAAAAIAAFLAVMAFYGLRSRPVTREQWSVGRLARIAELTVEIRQEQRELGEHQLRLEKEQDAILRDFPHLERPANFEKS